MRGVMLNVGGDLCVRGRIDRTIGIAAPWADSESSEPLACIAVENRSVATSGSSSAGCGFKDAGILISSTRGQAGRSST